MKRFLITLLIAVTTFAIMTSTAEARRLGGGGSFGKSSSYSRQNSATPSQPSYAAPRPAAPAAAPGGVGGAAKPASPWRGIIGGALLGLGLGALFSHLGIGGAMASMLSSILMFAVIALVIMFVFRMFNRKNNPKAANQPFFPGGTDNPSSYSPPAAASSAPSALSSYSSGTPEIGSGLPSRDAAGSSSLNAGFGSSGAPLPTALEAMPLGIPADFDVAGFVRNAKSYFIRLQAAGDRGDIHDIREFTSPEMFAELKLQIQERGTTPNVTDVVKLDGELLGIEQISDEYLATVRFTGLIKEAPDASAEPFVELWNFGKPVDGVGGWVLAGIQQAT